MAWLPLLFFVLSAMSGCARELSGTRGPERPATHQEAVFSMGGVRITVPGPEGYAPAANFPEAAALGLFPPELVLALFYPAGATPDQEQNAPPEDKPALVSARPEFMNEYVEQDFFRAMGKDILRVHGQWDEKALERFRALTENYYAGGGAFAHSLGVYHSTPYSLSVAQIVRKDEGSRDDASALPDAAGAGAASDPEAWAAEYFAGMPHRARVWSVLLLNGRCFNIYFSSPLTGEDDLRKLMERSRRYMEEIAKRAEPGS